jgi:hypothetical protein
MIFTSGKCPLEKVINREVFPQAPSPTTTNFLRTPKPKGCERGPEEEFALELVTAGI